MEKHYPDAKRRAVQGQQSGFAARRPSWDVPIGVRVDSATEDGIGALECQHSLRYVCLAKRNCPRMPKEINYRGILGGGIAQVSVCDVSSANEEYKWSADVDSVPLCPFYVTEGSDEIRSPPCPHVQL